MRLPQRWGTRSWHGTCCAELRAQLCAGEQRSSLPDRKYYSSGKAKTGFVVWLLTCLFRVHQDDEPSPLFRQDCSSHPGAWSLYFVVIRLKRAGTQSSGDRDVAGYSLEQNLSSGNTALNIPLSEVVIGRLDRILLASPLHLFSHGPHACYNEI